MKDIIIPDETLMSKVYLIRENKVMVDSDLAELYQVETRVFNQSIKRNLKRFPEDFMFQLTEEEWTNLISQIGTSSWGGRRTLPYVFTEQGVAMLSSILRSDTAISVNIQIIRIFSKMREMLLTNKDILLKLGELENKVLEQDENILAIFDCLKQLIVEKNTDTPEIGFRISKKDSK